MRIVHTADWHIGQTLAGHRRDDEHRAVLAALVRVVTEREADALVVAGDVFDNQSPSGEALRLYYEALMALRRARPELQIVVTAGNHDAPGRLEAPAPLLAAMGTTVVGAVQRREGRIDGGRHLVALRDGRSRIAAELLAVSHPTAACLPGLAGPEAPEGISPVTAATRALYTGLVEATGAGRAGLPLVVTGHLHVAGGLESEGAERRILVGGQHAVPPDVFPAAAAYVALGHLHRAQTLAGGDGAGGPIVRYAGSLLPLSASEIGYRHGVTLLTLGAGAPTVEHIEIARPLPFLRLPEQGATRLDELGDRLVALGLDPGLPMERRPFVQVVLAREDTPRPGLRAEVDRIIDGFPVRALPLVIERTDGTPFAVDAGPAVRLADLAPEEVFRAAFGRRHGRPPEAAHLAAFHRAAALAAGEP